MNIQNFCKEEMLPQCSMVPFFWYKLNSKGVARWERDAFQIVIFFMACIHARYIVWQFSAKSMNLCETVFFLLLHSWDKENRNRRENDEKRNSKTLADYKLLEIRKFIIIMQTMSSIWHVWTYKMIAQAEKRCLDWYFHSI